MPFSGLHSNLTAHCEPMVKDTDYSLFGWQVTFLVRLLNTELLVSFWAKPGSTRLCSGSPEIGSILVPKINGGNALIPQHPSSLTRSLR
jgi:hypothetical protein